MLKKTLFSIATEAASEPATNFFMQAFQNFNWSGVIAFDLLSFFLVFGAVAYTRLPLMDTETQRDRIALHLVDLI